MITFERLDVGSSFSSSVSPRNAGQVCVWWSMVMWSRSRSREKNVANRYSRNV